MRLAPFPVDETTKFYNNLTTSISALRVVSRRAMGESMAWGFRSPIWHKSDAWTHGFSAQWLYALAACPQRLGDDELCA